MASGQLAGRYTVDEYHRLVEGGVLQEDARVELIAGRIVPLSPIGPRHAAVVRNLTALLAPRVAPRAVLDVQSPTVLDDWNEPQPDLAILTAPRERYRDRLPGPADTILVIEVADSTARHDRRVKVPLYARLGMPELWLVDVTLNVVEVYRSPVDGHYTDVSIQARGATLAPRALPDLSLAVDDILG
jgi:Uma2 family endonuclease